MQTIILSDFANEEEYRSIKIPHGTAASSLAEHRQLLSAAVQALTEQGNEVEIEICDLAGYTEFCKKQNALNTPQTVAAYVLLKHGGVEKNSYPELKHQNITVHVVPKKLYGAYDEDSGEVYAVYPTAEACAGLPTVALVENFTGEPSDWTDTIPQRKYIALDRLAAAFRDLCQQTGMKKGALAKICGKNPNMFTRYCQGTTPVPKLIWEKVAEFKH